MPSLTSGSRWDGDRLSTFTEGPGGGSGLALPGVGGGGPGGEFMGMFESMLGEKKAQARADERRRADLHSEYMRAQRKKRAPKMAAAKKAGPMDPMRYVNKARTAARGDSLRSGVGFSAPGMDIYRAYHAGEKGAGEAAAMYPMYYQAMLGA